MMLLSSTIAVFLGWSLSDCLHTTGFLEYCIGYVQSCAMPLIDFLSFLSFRMGCFSPTDSSLFFMVVYPFELFVMVVPCSKLFSTSRWKYQGTKAEMLGHVHISSYIF